MSVEKNEIVTIEIESMTHDGFGVGRINGFAVFVPFTAVGDVLDAIIVKVEKTFAYGKIEQLKKLSENRIRQDCRVYYKCGGCSYSHLTYDEEIRIKKEKVQNAITRIGGLETTVLDVVRADNITNYRNKGQYPIGKDKDGNIIIGFFARNSHNIVDVESCEIQNPIFSEILAIFKDWATKNNIDTYDEKTGKGLLRHIYIRSGTVSGEIVVCVVINGDSLPKSELLISALSEKIKGLVGICLNINKKNTNVILGDKIVKLWGREFIFDNLGALKFKISPLSFYQVNPAQTKKLYDMAIKEAGLTGKETVIDLYCGIGTITLTAALHCKKIYGVEIVHQAVEDARENAKINGIANAEFIYGKADYAAKVLKDKGISPDVVIVDPPRKGLEGDLIETIVKMSPKKVVYVSCDPATLARDLKIFNEKGYKPKHITPVDMFPRTYHVECVAVISRVES